jgi:phosphoglycolate phosphatase
MYYYFFDIDGTLLLSGGAGRVAMTRVMQEMFGLTELQQLEVHGRTDRGIIEELFARHEIPLDEERHREFSDRYHELLPASLGQCDGYLMPGVTELLQLLDSLSSVRLGILTGNSESAAWAKLRHFGLDHYFEFGGFGGDFVRRDDVARQALESCRVTCRDETIEGRQTWVIGDTIHDISCARSIGARVVAVATGGCEVPLLEMHSPDVLLPDLSDHDGFLQATQD